jgi:hypothetical protein
VHFSRHAKNRARELGVSIEDVEAVMANPLEIDIRESGRIRYIGYVRDERVRVVVPIDDPDLIVTIHRRFR